ncbi:suppressor of G2 allele of SKP1-like protein [Dinothrombium tinctorium]|uniref:Suppressor of G2 allele of SKP1-like protein n=1 Tax=Dinothrombium tinctorium TaxID=1965070 RepID=A0A3S3PRH6_9ACAR|nr:suppressor of G2 allele of SKP1-like protein [Dinothrombium tinctorium]
MEAKGKASDEKPRQFTRKNWDKIVKEFEEEESKNDDSVDNLFRKIYANSSEEVRKAMNKSFVESGGTCLSTNWEEVSKKKMEVKPPDGVEFRKWD